MRYEGLADRAKRQNSFGTLLEDPCGTCRCKDATATVLIAFSLLMEVIILQYHSGRRRTDPRRLPCTSRKLITPREQRRLSIVLATLAIKAGTRELNQNLATPGRSIGQGSCESGAGHLLDVDSSSSKFNSRSDIRPFEDRQASRMTRHPCTRSRIMSLLQSSMSTLVRIPLSSYRCNRVRSLY